MLQNLDLDTLQHILEQFSEDVLNDCSRIICKLLNSSNEAALLENQRIFTSLEVLLGLYEKISADKSNSKVRLPVSLIIKNIKKLIYSNSKSGFYSDRNINSKILSIVQFTFKISYLENSVEALEEFAKLYMHIIACLSSDDLATKCKSDYVIFHLKMLNTIYNVLESICCESSKQEFYKKSRTDYTDESNVYTKLVFHSGNKIAIQTLLFLTPGYLNCFNFKTVPEKIWKEISKSVSNSSVDYSRAMLILCNFFEKAEVENQTHFILNLFEDASFWELLQLVLIENDPVLRKQGMYVFKKSVDLLKNTKKTITCFKNNIIFYWDLNFNNELYELYNDVITILEFLDEQQVHIIKPIFKLAKSLCKKVVSINKMNLSWVFLIYCKALNHNSTNIIKWGMTDMLELPLSFFTQQSNARKTVASLMPVLNSLDLYYSDGMTVSDHLRSFFFKLAFENNAKIFFHVFIEHLCSLVWSPEALFFVAHALNICNLYRTCNLSCSFWEEQDISQLRTFVKQSFKTFHQVIKIGIQCNLLGAISTFTDVKHVSLKSIILLISSFPMMEFPDYYGETWLNLRDWLHTAYSRKDFNEILDLYKKQELREEFNEKFIVLLFELSDFVSFDKICDVIEPEPKTQLEEMLLLFKDIDKRPYCDKELYDYYLSVISHFYVGNVSKVAMIKNLFPYVIDVLYYIRNQLKLLVNLNEFHTCQFYLNAFKNIIRNQNLFEYMSEEIRNFYTDVLSDLEVFLNSESNMSSVGLYSRIKMLDNLLQTHPCKVELTSIVPFFLTEVNKPLKKDKAYCEQTKDVQTLWGKMNSEFIEVKWSILKYFIKEKLVVRGGDQIKVFNTISDYDLVQLCIDGLRPGGYGVLSPIMSILKDILPTVDNHTQVREIITSLWKLIMERKKTDEFKLFVKNFVEMLFQEAFFLKGDSFEETLKEYADLIFSHPSLAVVNIFIRHIQKTDLAKCSVTLYCHIIGKALIFGPVLRKDEKLTNKVCFEIQKHKIYPLWSSEQSYGKGKYTKAKDNYCWNPTNLVNSWPENNSDYYSSNEIRARAVEKVLTLHKDSPTDQALVKNLVKTLIKMHEEVCSNRKRYFGGSYVHRVKHRVLQSLLLLDHLHCLDLNETRKLLQWLCNGLATENPQPSVRYQQMWLIVRILIKNTELQIWFKNLWRAEEFKKKGSLCSYLSVILHFYRLLPHLEYLGEFDNYSEFLIHQNFEVRLYAQVLFLDLFNLAEQRKQTDFTEKWANLYLLLDRATRSLLNENQVTRNFQKVSKNFFFRIFHPLNHYSLDTIYETLPSATDMAPDEWISTRLFQYCGVDPSKVDIPLWSVDGFLISSWNTKRDSGNEVEFEDQKLNETLKNYQKKIIPIKSLISDLEEENKRQTFGEERNGLVVVASLIDRIPNLGGLARTCEIFGVSELVLGSLKYTDDKQFTSLSVTAEKWITVKEVKPQDLITYIEEMKQNGYTVVGAEQTLQSKSLTSVTFPEKTLLLLGNEKEGIPPNLLSFLDVCVEIPQRGIIRSLNVHVTGALFIWEYAKQRFFS